MFDHLGDSGRRAMTAALAEARSLGHQRVGTEHLLLGLLADPSWALPRALAGVGVSAADVRAEVGGVPERARVAGQGSGLLPLSPRLRRIVDLAVRSAWGAGTRVEADDLLAGLLADGAGAGVGVMRWFGVDPARVLAAPASVDLREPRSAARGASAGG